MARLRTVTLPAEEAALRLTEKNEAICVTTDRRKKKVWIMKIEADGPIKLVTWKEQTYVIPTRLVGATFCLDRMWIFEIRTQGRDSPIRFQFTDQATRLQGEWGTNPSAALGSAYFKVTGQEMDPATNGRGMLGIYTSPVRAIVVACCKHKLTKYEPLLQVASELVSLHVDKDETIELINDPIVVSGENGPVVAVPPPPPADSSSGSKVLVAATSSGPSSSSSKSAKRVPSEESMTPGLVMASQDSMGADEPANVVNLKAPAAKESALPPSSSSSSAAAAGAVAAANKAKTKAPKREQVKTPVAKTAPASSSSEPQGVKATRVAAAPSSSETQAADILAMFSTRRPVSSLPLVREASATTIHSLPGSSQAQQVQTQADKSGESSSATVAPSSGNHGNGEQVKPPETMPFVVSTPIVQMQHPPLVQQPVMIDPSLSGAVGSPAAAPGQPLYIFAPALPQTMVQFPFGIPGLQPVPQGFMAPPQFLPAMSGQASLTTADQSAPSQLLAEISQLLTSELTSARFGDYPKQKIADHGDSELVTNLICSCAPDLSKVLLKHAPTLPSDLAQIQSKAQQEKVTTGEAGAETAKPITESSAELSGSSSAKRLKNSSESE